jgi:hypothetical protein
MNTDVDIITESHASSKPSDGNFIEDYVEYADIFEAPPEAHEAVAITAISAAANGNVWIRNGGQTVTLDKWTLLLSGSGVGRNTLVSLLWPVLKDSGLENLVRNTSWGSKQGFYQDLAENPTGFFVWEEVSSALKALSDSRFGEAKQWLTNCYDNLRTPADIRYRKTNLTQDTPPIVFGAAPRLSILATSSHDWFVNSLSEEDSTGGFIPRWFLIDLPALDRVIPTPKEPKIDAIPNLADCLREVRNLRGAVDLSKVQSMYADWYADTRKRFREQPNATMAEAFWNRHRVHILKLATIYAMSEGGNLTISPQAMDRAIAAARRTEATIFRLVPTGMSREGAAVDKLEQRIRLGGEMGLLKSEFTRAFQHIREQERESRLRTLQSAGTVVIFDRPTEGRRAEVFVHKDHAEAHEKAFPQDRRK